MVLKSRKKVITYIVMFALMLFFFFPLLYMLSVSFNPDEMDILESMASIRAFFPGDFSLKNYFDVFDRMPFGRFLFNSLFIVSTTIILGLVANSMAAFGLARFNFKGRGLMLAGVIALMIIPFEAIAVPLLLITNKFGWLDSYKVQIIPFIANPFYIFLLYQFFTKFPKELEEAAIIDGAGWHRIFWQVALPLSKPILSSVAILHFLMQWGSFLWPKMVTRGPEFRPLTVAMQVFFGQYPRNWGDIMSFAAMMTLPVLILFVILQDAYVNSVTRSGIK
ncbi:carbohydrate ABC transporter permease [Halothermothrix orenii]|uniref:Binding-protein-dependent transport systems inner membrane component n=1 Tax=Halothermothrix orenii (strain H 168 / OCM 544 / DSM 9562) TaxID=373903 RepID=B8CYD4_HALOH|nr:carbohydrate ABC transporter permease [Halothermothrix orenii]ACL70303.1 binding-protein-dependent transport systems inner membrane component [Halothermothrix orenii H 168]